MGEPRENNWEVVRMSECGTFQAVVYAALSRKVAKEYKRALSSMDDENTYHARRNVLRCASCGGPRNIDDSVIGGCPKCGKPEGVTR